MELAGAVAEAGARGMGARRFVQPLLVDVFVAVEQIDDRLAGGDDIRRRGVLRGRGADRGGAGDGGGALHGVRLSPVAGRRPAPPRIGRGACRPRHGSIRRAAEIVPGAAALR